MVLCDERILEYLSEHDSGTPSEMANSGFVRWTRSYISQRAQKLVNHGLLKHLGNGVYIINDAGEAYLKEEYDAEAGRYLDQDQTSAPDTTTGAGNETENAG